MAHGTNGSRTDRPAGFRSDGRSGTTNVAGEWAGLPAAMWQMVDRLRGVTIRSEPAQLLIDEYRDPKVLIYLDPPYMPEARSAKSKQREGYHAYSHELTIEDHAALLDQIGAHPAMIMLSGYDTALYRERLAGWQIRTKRARAHRNSPRTELLWLNPLAAERLCHGPLFGNSPSLSPDKSPDDPQLADLSDLPPQLFRPTVHSEREG
jgi:DNA adenine methylase